MVRLLRVCMGKLDVSGGTECFSCLPSLYFLTLSLRNLVFSGRNKLWKQMLQIFHQMPSNLIFNLFHFFQGQQLESSHIVVMLRGVGKVRCETRSRFGLVPKSRENIIWISFRSLNLWKAVYHQG